MAGNSELYVVVRAGDDEPNASVKIPLSKGTSEFYCSTCGQTFAKRPYLVRHTKVKHGLSVESAKELPDVVGRCPNCLNKFQKRIDLLYHLANEHKCQITVFDLKFSDASSFIQWFEEIKMYYQTSFASHSAKVLRDGTKTKMYHCNRDVQANGRKTRRVYSRATTDYCTAHLYVRQKVSGEISVLGSPTHMNHEVDPSLVTKPNLPMSRTARGYREIIASMKMPQECLGAFQKVDPLVKRMQTHLSAKPHRRDAAMTVHNLLLKVRAYNCNMANAKPGTTQRDTRVFLERIVAQSLDALLKDISRIRFAFEAKKSARFEDFSATFRELKASMLYQGHASETNAKIFIEDMYEVLLLEFEDTQVILAKIFIIYMLYASYYCQTCRPRVPIRLRQDDEKRLEEFMETCRKDNHSDIIYAFRRLQADCAFHYVHTLRSYGFKSYVLDPQQSTHRKMRLNNRIASHRYLLNSTDLFRRLSFVHENYCELKRALNLKAEEEALERQNPFEEMHKSVLTAGKTAHEDEEETREDAEHLSDDDGDGDEDIPEEDPEVVIELNADDFEHVTKSVS